MITTGDVTLKRCFKEWWGRSRCRSLFGVAEVTWGRGGAALLISGDGSSLFVSKVNNFVVDLLISSRGAFWERPKWVEGTLIEAIRFMGRRMELKEYELELD